MTRNLVAQDVAEHIQKTMPDAVVHCDENALWINPDSVLQVCQFLHDSDELALDFLSSITGVDYIDHFEVVYHLTSMKNNTKIVLKSKCQGRENPNIPSVVQVWQGANLQEREVYDLMGITFVDHPLMKRILLWEGFDGYPLRKDYLEPPR